MIERQDSRHHTLRRDDIDINIYFFYYFPFSESQYAQTHDLRNLIPWVANKSLATHYSERQRRVNPFTRTS